MNTAHRCRWSVGGFKVSRSGAVSMSMPTGRWWLQRTKWLWLKMVPNKSIKTWKNMVDISGWCGCVQKLILGCAIRKHKDSILCNFTHSWAIPHNHWTRVSPQPPALHLAHHHSLCPNIHSCQMSHFNTFYLSINEVMSIPFAIYWGPGGTQWDQASIIWF